MTLTDIQKAVLDENIDNVIAQYLKTGDCRVVYDWIEKNTIQLRFWALHKLTNINTLSPYKTATIVENAESDYDKFLFECYKKVDDLYPLTKTQTAKERARNRIYKELGDYDVYEMVADLSKRLGMLERLCVRVAKKLKDDGFLEGYIEDHYGPLVDQYVFAIDNGLIKDRVDLEDLQQLFTKIQYRANVVAVIVEEEIFNNSEE